MSNSIPLTEMPCISEDSFEDENIVETLMTNLDADMSRISARHSLDVQILQQYSILKANKTRNDVITKKMNKLKLEQKKMQAENEEAAKLIRDLQFKRDDVKPLGQAAATMAKCEVCHSMRQGMDMSYLSCQHQVCIKCVSNLTKETCPFCREPIDLVHTVEKIGSDNWKIVSHVIQMNINKRSKQHENIFKEISYKGNSRCRRRKYVKHCAVQTSSSHPAVKETNSRSLPHPVVEDTTIPSHPVVEDTTTPSHPVVEDTNSREVWNFINDINRTRTISIDEISNVSMVTNT